MIKKLFWATSIIKQCYVIKVVARVQKIGKNFMPSKYMCCAMFDLGLKVKIEDFIIFCWLQCFLNFQTKIVHYTRHSH